jgi:predicted DCC family thiol-disulfide oxidoreductase YuxK
MIYDGDCGFCRRWIESWRGMTGDQVDYATAQEVRERFPEIATETFEASVVLVDTDGSVYTGAEAVFRSRATVPNKRGWLWCYQKIPGWAALMEWGYRRVAHHRLFFSILTKPYTYYGSRRMFLMLLGVVYFFAFMSLAVQITGLVGREGILPAADFLSRAKMQLGDSASWEIPTVFWLGSSDVVLQGICWAGAALSLFLIVGIAPLPVTILLWVFYLSLYSVGQTFLGFQWDILLLEVGFLSIFLTPFGWGPRSATKTRSSTAVLWLFRWLLFRLIFQSGMVKLLSGDPAWRDLTALQYHYETQPLPTWIGYWVHQLPPWIHHRSALLMFIGELILPFFIFMPGRIRVVGAVLLIFFQVIIAATGNYGFFNILTIALCVLLIPDQSWPKRIRRIFEPQADSNLARGSKGWPKWIIVPLTTLLLILSAARMEQRLSPTHFFSDYFTWLLKPVQSLYLANSYGLFAVMTKSRPEITIEGSRNGTDWLPYEFRWKPGDLKRKPAFVAPHMPRLDWQMWFAALRPPEHYPVWFHNLLIRLLEGSPPVLALLKENPFPEAPPSYVRAKVSNYYFTDAATKRATGNWWWRGSERSYAPVYGSKGQEQ